MKRVPPQRELDRTVGGCYTLFRSDAFLLGDFFSRPHTLEIESICSNSIVFYTLNIIQILSPVRRITDYQCNIIRMYARIFARTVVNRERDFRIIFVDTILRVLVLGMLCWSLSAIRCNMDCKIVHNKIRNILAFRFRGKNIFRNPYNILSVYIPHTVPNILITLVEPLRQRDHVPLVVAGHRIRKLHLVAVEWNRVWIKQNKRSPRRFCFGGLMRKMRIRTGIRPWARGDSSSLHAWRCGYRTHSP